MATDIDAAAANAAGVRPKNPNKVRKRAPKACLSCRARKVRCDVSQRGRPCMNCYLDSETCVVTGRASRLRKSQRPATAPANGTAAAATDAAATATAPSGAFPGTAGAGAAGAAVDSGVQHLDASGSGVRKTHAHAHSHHDHHSHGHDHDHDHAHMHQHGSPASDAASHHRSVSVKGSPAASESEPLATPALDGLHGSPAADGMDGFAGDAQAQAQAQAQAASQGSQSSQPVVPASQNQYVTFNNPYGQPRLNGSGGVSSGGNGGNGGNGISSSSTGNGNGNDFLAPAAGNMPWASEQGLNISADITYSYYPFLAISNLPGILPQDVNYLELQGCLRVPTRTILDEFVQQYFLHVHPLLPLFNEGDFWELYCQQGAGSVPPAGRMSLLVFQAVLFAACNFVSRNSIRALGFPTIRIARAALYRRAKLLFDFETESSPAAIAQAALLLSFWSPSVNSGTKNPNTAWLCTAVQQAKLAGAHHYAGLLPTSTSGAANGPSAAQSAADAATARRANALKRLWWCCIIRDRIMGLGVRRSIQITRAHFDFEANPPLSRADLADEVERSRVYNPGTKSCLIEILVHMVELCVVLTDILTLVFPQDDTPGWGRQLADDDAGRVRQCKIELRRWYKDVALKFPMFGSSSGGGGAGGGTVPGMSRLASGNGREYYHDSVILYTNLMYMYYHSSRVALCHHEVLHIAVANAATTSGPPSAKAVAVIYENRHELQDAASGVTECLKELIQLRLARWLPISAVACTALPLFLHILDVKLSALTAAANNPNPGSHHATTASTPSDANGSAGSDVSTSASSALKQHRLNILIEAMKTYQPQYDGVDWVSETIRHIVNLAQLDGPIPGPSGAGGANGSGGGGVANGAASSTNGITDWADILAINPSWYLRLALTIDIALSKNRMPEERDFPIGLRGLFTGGVNTIRSLRLGYNRDGSVQANGGADSSNHSNSGNNGSSTNGYYTPANGTNTTMASVSGAPPPHSMSAAAGVATTMGGATTLPGPAMVPPPSSMDGMMDDPVMAAAAAAAANAAMNGSAYMAGHAGSGSHSTMASTATNNPISATDYSSAAFMLAAPHHLAMTMGMAIGMDMDMDLIDMDVDMVFPASALATPVGMMTPMGMMTPQPMAPPHLAGNPLAGGGGGGIITQLPSSDEETSPAGSGSASGLSEAATPPAAHLHSHSHTHSHAHSHQQHQQHRQHQQHSHTRVPHNHRQPPRGKNGRDGKGGLQDANGDDWIEQQAWGDDGGEMREGGDRDTARALLEAMGEGAA